MADVATVAECKASYEIFSPHKTALSSMLISAVRAFFRILGTRVDSSVPLMHHDSIDLGSLIRTRITPKERTLIRNTANRFFPRGVKYECHVSRSRFTNHCTHQPRSQGPLSTSRKYPGYGWSRVC